MIDFINRLLRSNGCAMKFRTYSRVAAAAPPRGHVVTCHFSYETNECSSRGESIHTFASNKRDQLNNKEKKRRKEHQTVDSFAFASQTNISQNRIEDKRLI